MASQAALSSDHKTFHLSESSEAQYIIAVVVAALVYFGVGWYAKLADPELTAAVINRGSALGTLVLLGLVLLLGPMSRMVGGVWHTAFMFRKELGVVTFVLGFAHVYLSMFMFARRGPLGFYTGRPWSAYPGLMALVIMAVLTFFSFTKTQKLLSPITWWKMQYMGARTAFIGIVAHVVVLRYAGWGIWLQDLFGGGTPTLPPAALLGTIFALYVLAVRMIDFSKSRTKLGTLSVVTFGFVAITMAFFVPQIRSFY